MPRGKTTSKVTGKPARQLLFSEAFRQQKHPSVEDSPPAPCANMTEDTQGATMDRILQEGMDNAMVALTAETRSMRLDLVRSSMGSSCANFFCTKHENYEHEL
ncbi:hypothetical protein NDU88_007728 [Pleurodeles waltl]|uniref:Uncharacterized protein n=1 Tax=Pleurodeles waltl TaxID=8319 RepID=A0AAV7PM52_PLEWA|nr:hypothetical protein NDU88_007728 [Pleurodeles waltl]